MDRRKTGLKKWEWGILAAVVALCGVVGVWLYQPRAAQAGAVALIHVDGEDRYLVEVPSGEEWTFSIQAETGKPVSFQVGAEGIRFIQVDCPDHLCEEMGWCLTPGNRAVCLPNRTFLAVYDRRELPKTQAQWLSPPAARLQK